MPATIGNKTKDNLLKPVLRLAYFQSVVASAIPTTVRNHFTCRIRFFKHVFPMSVKRTRYVWYRSEMVTQMSCVRPLAALVSLPCLSGALSPQKSMCFAWLYQFAEFVLCFFTLRTRKCSLEIDISGPVCVKVSRRQHSRSNRLPFVVSPIDL